MTPERLERARQIAAQLRVDCVRSTTRAGSGHPTSCLSAADLVSVLLCNHLRWDPKRPDNPRSDHFILSKGHAAPLLYAMLKAVGVVSEEELLTLRRFGSRLQGHPGPDLPGIDVATGSLGQGLPIAVGVALPGKYLEKLPYRVWVLLGDSGMSEGSVWEAFDHARHYALGNVIAILDMNRLGQSRETPLGWDSAAYARRARAFGWDALEIDGHDLEAIDGAYFEATRTADAPTLIVARTKKGKGVSLVEDRDGWHGKALDEEKAEAAIAELGGAKNLVIDPLPPPPAPEKRRPTDRPLALPAYDGAKPVATRKAYGEALAALGSANGDVVALDGEVSNSTFSADFAEAHPERYFEMYISEQQLVAAAVGFSVKGKVPFASTFAAFFTRAYDFIRMAAVSRANIRLCGSHAGVSIGEDGPSQMGLEDLAMMRAVHGSTVLYPSCANQTARLVAEMARTNGVVYLRTTREKTPILYDAHERFPIGGSKILRAGDADEVTIIAAGITVHEALKAADKLAREGLPARVVDAYSVKPLDEQGIRAAVRDTAGRVVVVEDHWAEGGLGEAVLACLAGEAVKCVHLAVRDMPGSGRPAELLRAAHIDAASIARAAESLAGAPRSGAQRRACYVCGRPAAVRIAIAGEDEPHTEEYACEAHARGHIRIAREAS
jgi:transketolase